MLPLISQAISLGYTATQVLKFLSSKVKGVQKSIQSAQSQGYSDDDILNFLGGKLKTSKQSSDNQLSANEQYLKNQGFKTKEERKESQNKFISGAMQLGGTALGAYALSRALPQSGNALQGQLLPAQANAPIGLAKQLTGPQARPQLTGPQPRPQAPVTSPLPNQPIQPNITSVKPPISPISPLPTGLQKQASALLEAGNTPEQIEAALRSTQPKIVKEYEKETKTPIKSAIEEFTKNVPAQTQAHNVPAQTQAHNVPEQTQAYNVPAQSQSMSMSTGMPESNQAAPSLNQTVKQDISSIEKVLIKSPEDLKEFANNPDKFNEVKKIVALPNGEIGEITNIRQGIATVNANGKEYRRKISELEEAPKDLEEATRHLVNLIPEKEKSTAFQESIHLTLPGMEGKETPVMITKYYGGKWAWYLDVSNDDYNKIALGTFSPKGEAKTGIGEYKPGIIDSRGAGNQELIIQNPKYSKANKGKTWDYADSKYDMMQSINATLQKMSRERKDEKGNIIKKREKQAGKSNSSPGLSEPQSKRTKKK